MGGLEKTNDDVDCRAIKKDFLKKFKSGDYNVFLELVKKYSDELVLCFRGNNTDSEAVCIYYNNHLVYKIEDNDNITINFDHARYTPKYWDFWKKITRDYGFIPIGDRREEEVPKVTVVSKGGGSYDATVGEITACLNENVLKNVENIYYNCLRPMLIDSFDLSKKRKNDQFKAIANQYAKYRGKITQTTKKIPLEKIRQQQLFYAMKSTQNGYFSFDMEFSQKSMKDQCKEEIRNQTDMLAIRFENGVPKAYVLVEVKSKKKACNGESGVEKHLIAMEQYSKSSNMTARRREAALIISHYKELGLYQFPENIEEADYMELPVEILFIFTDDAVSKYENEFDKVFEDTGLSSEYEKKPHGDLGIHLPSCKRLKIVGIEKN